MPDRWTLLGLVVALAAGLAAVATVSSLARTRPASFFRPFTSQLLLFNLLTLGGLAIRFVQLEIAEGRAGLPSWGMPALLGSLFAVKIGWLAAFLAAIRELVGPRLTQRARRSVKWGAIGAAAAATSALVAGLWLDVPAVVAAALGGIEVLTLGGALCGSIFLAARARTAPEGPRRHALLGLGVTYTVIFAGICISLASGWALPEEQVRAVHLVQTGLLTIFNLLPLFWISRLQPPHDARWDASHFGLTPREEEITRLVAGGKTNQEIADALFISLATVKDHNHRIFRKTGVRNRTELSNLVRESSSRRPGDDR